MGNADQIAKLRVNKWIDSQGGDREQPVRLSDFSDKSIYLFCWQAWCPGCHQSGFPTFRAVYDKLKDDDEVVFLAVQTVFEGFDVNTADKLREMQLQYELPVLFGHDAGGGKRSDPSYVMQDFHTGGTPWHIIMDTTHVAVYGNFRIEVDRAVALLKEEVI